ncbi:MAG TPA: undecaprenyl-diphosphate phosphatase [Pseudomonadales bacterium]
MDWLQLVVLALIQGITEFLPVSSSAHLILPGKLFGWPDQGLAFDVAVHVGSLAAVLAYFRRDLMGFAVGGWRAIAQRQVTEPARELAQLAVATLPIVLAGLVVSDWVASEARNLLVIGLTTIVFGLLLGYADRRHGERAVLSWTDALVIGAMQVLALIPGTSRSGITMTAALLLGLSRVSAARFSFLLSIPTIAGAGLLAGVELAAAEHHLPWSVLGTGALLAGLAAYACIGTFIALVERTGMLPYVIYRLLLGTVLLTIWMA